MPEYIVEAEQLDATQLIRCRDCKFWGVRGGKKLPTMFCTETIRYTDGNGYCWLGEKKEGKQ